MRNDRGREFERRGRARSGRGVALCLALIVALTGALFWFSATLSDGPTASATVHGGNPGGGPPGPRYVVKFSVSASGQPVLLTGGPARVLVGSRLTGGGRVTFTRGPLPGGTRGGWAAGALALRLTLLKGTVAKPEGIENVDIGYLIEGRASYLRTDRGTTMSIPLQITNGRFINCVPGRRDSMSLVDGVRIADQGLILSCFSASFRDRPGHQMRVSIGQPQPVSPGQ